MTAPVITCLVCGEIHGKNGNWREAEFVRSWCASGAEFPVSALAPIRQDRVYDFNVFGRGLRAKRDKAVSFTWGEYFGWLTDRSQEVHPKHELFVSNLSNGPKRKDHNQAYFDSIYLDCDNAGDWHKLKAFCAYYGIPAIFHESSGSVGKRTEAGDLAGQLVATKWHVIIPLAYRVLNPWSTNETDPPSDYRWNHFQSESKRAYRHLVGLFSAFAGFGGTGGNCGFDLATTGLCVPRFLGTRTVTDGPLPYLSMGPGDKAVDYDELLRLTGFVKTEATPPRARVTTVKITTPSGKIRERTLHDYSDQLYEDVKARISVDDLLQNYLGPLSRAPTATQGGNSNYYCPVHGEEFNPSNLPGGPNKFGFHVFRGSTRWNCFGDCEESGKKGGDVIHLAALLWFNDRSRRGEAAWRLAKEAGLDLDKYRSRVESFPDDPGYEAPEEEEEEEPEGFDGLVEGEHQHQRRRKTDASQLSHVAEWTERWILPGKSLKARTLKVNDAIRAASRVLLERKAPWEREKEEPDPDKRETYHERLKREAAEKRAVEKAAAEARDGPVPLNDPEELAATFWAVLHEHLTLDQAQGEVYDVASRLQEDRATAGRGWLVDHLGHKALFELGAAAWKDDQTKPPKQRSGYSFMEFMKSTLSFDIYQSGAKATQDCPARKQTYGVQALNAISDWVRHTVVTSETEEERKAREQFAKRILRPLICRKTRLKGKTTGGRDLANYILSCKGRGCIRCAMNEALKEHEIALPQWQEIGGPFYFVRLQLEDLDQVDSLKEYMRKLGRNKLFVQGTNPETGKPRCTWVCTDVVDESYVTGKLSAWLGREVYDNCRKDMLAHDLEEWTVEDPEAALATVLQEKLSVHVQLRDLVQKAQEATDAVKAGELSLEESNKAYDAVVDFHTWVHRRQLVISRAAGSLPWPTKAQLKAASGEGFELLEGETAEWSLIDVASGFLIAKRIGHPYSIDEAGTNLMIRKREVLQARQNAPPKAQRARRPRARAPTR